MPTIWIQWRKPKVTLSVLLIFRHISPLHADFLNTCILLKHSWLTVSQVHSETTRLHTHAALLRRVRYGPESARTFHGITNQNRDIKSVISSIRVIIFLTWEKISSLYKKRMNMFVAFSPKIYLILITAVKYSELKELIFPSWWMHLFYAIIWLLILDHSEVLLL